MLQATVCAADMQNKDGVGHVLEVHTEHCVDNLAGHVLTLKTIIYWGRDSWKILLICRENNWRSDIQCFMYLLKNCNLSGLMVPSVIADTRREGKIRLIQNIKPQISKQCLPFKYLLWDIHQSQNFMPISLKNFVTGLLGYWLSFCYAQERNWAWRKDYLKLQRNTRVSCWVLYVPTDDQSTMQVLGKSVAFPATFLGFH